MLSYFNLNNWSWCIELYIRINLQFYVVTGKISIEVGSSKESVENWWWWSYINISKFVKNNLLYSLQSNGADLLNAEEERSHPKKFQNLSWNPLLLLRYATFSFSLSLSFSLSYPNQLFDYGISSIYKHKYITRNCE